MTDEKVRKQIDLEVLKDRIKALRAKTVANGCTEAEAMTAA
jgi:hypothetical protein